MKPDPACPVCHGSGYGEAKTCKCWSNSAEPIDESQALAMAQGFLDRMLGEIPIQYTAIVKHAFDIGRSLGRVEGGQDMAKTLARAFDKPSLGNVAREVPRG